MDINNNNYNQNKEFAEIIKKRDRKRFSRELVDLEKQEASYWNRILWNVISLLIAEPIGATAATYFFLDQINFALRSNMVIQNLGTNLKWTALGIAGAFALTSLTLIFHLWKVASLKNEIAKIKGELSHLE